MHDDGGPAYPSQEVDRRRAGRVEKWRHYKGKSLRDDFAGQAMQALVSHAFVYWQDKHNDAALTPDAIQITKDVARAAYHMADAMLVARKEGHDG